MTSLGAPGAVESSPGSGDAEIDPADTAAVLDELDVVRGKIEALLQLRFHAAFDPQEQATYETLTAREAALLRRRDDLVIDLRPLHEPID